MAADGTFADVSRRSLIAQGGRPTGIEVTIQQASHRQKADVG